MVQDLMSTVDLLSTDMFSNYHPHPCPYWLSAASRGLRSRRSYYCEWVNFAS